MRKRRLLVGGMLGCAVALASRVSPAQTGAIMGVVTESASGRPVGAATVTATGGPEGLTVRARTGADGAYRIADLSAGTYRIVARHFAFAATRALSVLVPAGGAVTADVRMSRTRTDDAPVVSAVSRVEERASAAPAFATVIGADAIARRPVMSLAGLLGDVAGVNVNRNGMLSANIALRGFNDAFSSAALLLTDGRVATLPSLRGNVPSLMPPILEDIERIEVVPGAHSAIYGPNAAAGVVQVITRSPFTSAGTSLTVDGGSQSFFRRSLRVAGVVTPKVAYKVSAQYLSGTDWAFKDASEPLAFPPSAPTGRAAFPNARDFDVKQSSGEARLDLRPTSNSEFITTIGAAHIGNGLEYFSSLGAVQIRNASITTLQQRLRVGRLSAQVYANRLDAGSASGDDLNGSYELRTGTPLVNTSRQFAAQMQHAMSVGERHQLFYGAEFSRIDPRTGGLEHGANEDHDRSHAIGAFVQSRRAFGEKLDVIAALRAGRDTRVSGTRVSPRVALVYSPSAVRTFRVSVNRGYALPEDNMLFSDHSRTTTISGVAFNVRFAGNPPKDGFRFNRSCAASGPHGLCMMTSETGKQWLPLAVAPHYRQIVKGAANQIGNSLRNEFRQQGLSDAEAAQLAVRVVSAMLSLEPTSDELIPQLRYFGQRLTIGQTGTGVVDPRDVRDVRPLRGAESTTWEVGYSGVLWDRLRLTTGLWTERRTGISSSLLPATPLVFIDKAALARFLTAPIEQVLLSAGLRPAFATAAAAAIAAGQSTRLSQDPVGVVQFLNDGFNDPNTLVRTAQTAGGAARISGFDLAFDLALPSSSLSGSYSWVDHLTFPAVTFTDRAPLSLNAPNHRASLALHYQRGSWGGEIGGRYRNGYPVNSGNFSTDLRVAQTTTERVFDPIFAAAMLDGAVHLRFQIGRTAVTWSLRGENLTDHPSRDLPGTPLIGRTFVTRLSYVF